MSCATPASRWRSSSRPIAIVARDAAEAIVVDYDTLPAVVDPELAMTGKPTVIHADFANNLAVPLVPSGTGVPADFQNIDNSAVEKAFAERRGRDLAADGESPARPERDGAARRGRALRTGAARR